MNKRLERKIETKLDQLQALLDNTEEARHLDPNDSETWDSDTIYNLTEELKSALVLLEGQKNKQSNQYGELTLEPGLCSLMDDWESQWEEEEDA